MASEKEQITELFEEGSQRITPIRIPPESTDMSPEEAQQLEISLNRSIGASASSDIMNPSERFVSSDVMQVTQVNDNHIKSLAGQMASIKYAINPELGLEKHYEESRLQLESSVPIEDTIKGAVAEFQEYYTGILQDMVLGTLDDTPSKEAIEVGLDAQQIMGETVGSFQQPDALEAAQILSLTGKEDRLLAERNFYIRKIHEMSAGVEMFDNFVNIAGLFLPDVHFDAADLTGGSLLSAEEDTQRIIMNFQSQPIETRLMLFPTLQKEILEASDENELKAATRLLQLIDPTRAGEVSTEFLLDAIDWATIITPIIHSIGKTAKTYSALRSIKKAAESSEEATLADEVAGKTNAVIMADDSEAVSEATGTSREVAAMNTSPFKYEEVVPEATDGLSATTTKTLEEINLVRQNTQEELSTTLSGKNFLKESQLTVTERKLVETKELKKIEELKDSYYEQHGWHLEDAKIIDRNPEGVTVEYKLEGVEQRRKVTYTFKDVGEFDAMEAGQIVTKIWSPSTWMDNIQKDVVEVATRIGFAQSRVLNDLQNSIKAATKGLGSPFTPSGAKSRGRVDSVLVAGDEWEKGTGRVFSIEEMKYNGIPTDQGLLKLEDNEIASYYATRDVFDAFHFLKNKQVQDSLRFKGFKEVEVAGPLAETAVDLTIARPFERVQDIPNEVFTPNFRAWNADGSKQTGAVDNIKDMDLQDLYDRDYRMVRFKEAVKVADEEVEYGLVKLDQVSDLRSNIVNKKVGYVPKIADNGYYFVKEAKDAIINGSVKRGGSVRTIRMFDNRRDAQTYRDQLQEATQDKVEYIVRHDRELTSSELEDEIVAESGGLFTSSRSTREIKFGLNGDKPSRLSAFSAMERNLQHISNNLPMNEFRLGVQQRWLNSARQVDHTIKDFNSPIGLEPGTKGEVALRESRNWIKDQIRIPTEDERRWEALSRRTAEWMEGKPLLDGKIRRGVLDIGSKDPFSAMRAASFHSLLGWFNPAQLFVQAQGAAVALSLDPLAAPQRLRHYMALRAAMDIAHNEPALRKISKAAGLPEDEFVNIVREFDKTGLRQSVKTTADYAATSHGMGMSAGVLNKALSATGKAADKGLMFFREGETFTRGYAFLTARASWIKDNPGRIIDDEALKEITTRTVKKMFNLNRANRAYWQKGALSIPTQFQQITFKFIENMMPNMFPGAAKKFTAAEKRRIIAGQLFLYGSAGVPMGNMAAEGVAQWWGFKPGEIDNESWIARVNDGFWETTTQMAFGEGVDLAPRGAVASGIEQIMEDIFINQAPISETALGAFGAVPERAWRSLEVIGPMLLSNKDFEMTKDEAVVAASSVLSIVSSFNNAHKAWMWYKMGEVTDSKGNTILDLDLNKDMALIWGKALGFSPTRVSDHYEVKNFNRQMETMMREKRNAVKVLYKTYLTRQTITEQDKKNLNSQLKVILWGFNPLQIRELEKEVAGDIFNERDQEGAAILRALRNYNKLDDATKGPESILFNKQINSLQDEE